MSAKNPPVPDGTGDRPAGRVRDERDYPPGSTRRMIIAVIVVLLLVMGTAVITVAGAVRQHRHSVVLPGPTPTRSIVRASSG